MFLRIFLVILSEEKHNVIMTCYLLVGAVCFCNMSFALLEPTLPIWLLETMDAKKWQIGKEMKLQLTPSLAWGI